LYTGGWAAWKFNNSLNLDSGAVAYIWQVPPTTTAPSAFNGTFTESALAFMTPPNPSNLSTLKNRGAKMLVYHGTADPIFSSDDTQAWYENLRTANNGDASNFSRFFRVPGMNHCSGGPGAEQFDMLQPLVDWVERGTAPASVRAQVRGAGNAGGVNADESRTLAWAHTKRCRAQLRSGRALTGRKPELFSHPAQRCTGPVQAHA
jgi:hypothetical protein